MQLTLLEGTHSSRGKHVVRPKMAEMVRNVLASKTQFNVVITATRTQIFVCSNFVKSCTMCVVQFIKCKACTPCLQLPPIILDCAFSVSRIVGSKMYRGFRGLTFFLCVGNGLYLLSTIEMYHKQQLVSHLNNFDTRKACLSLKNTVSTDQICEVENRGAPSRSE